jgi:ubiquinone/menaquinone biosynthesis C-methylase UbiE
MPSPLFFELHSNLPREGPGDDATTRSVLLSLGLPQAPKVLDIGCGPGAQSLVLARESGGTVTAVDVHQPFLDELERRAENAGLEEQICMCRASMSNLPFADGAFDLIWSEGAIFIMGFAAGLTSWRRLLRAGGFLVASEATWLASAPARESLDFWHEAYPAMTTIDANRATIRACGFTAVAEYVLPKRSWFTEYYDPLEARIAGLNERHAAEPETLHWLAGERREIEIARRHGDAVGYVFYVMRRSD